MELEFERELSLSTAKECSSLPAALALLQQECQLCDNKRDLVSQCSSGFIANPRQRRLVCPDCRSVTCASCRRLSRGGCMHLTCPHCKHEFCSGCANPFLMGTKCTVSEYCAKLGLHAHHPRNCLFYLRDKEPQLLQKLLDDNNVEYKKDLPEREGARCTMQLQRETPDGMIDVTCSQPVIFSGLCRTHYIEYLVKQIGQQKLDPIAILDLNEAQQELRRRGKALPERPSHLTDDDYLKLCAKIVKEEIPLE